jgi:hypothetical protein
MPFATEMEQGEPQLCSSPLSVGPQKFACAASAMKMGPSNSGKSSLAYFRDHEKRTYVEVVGRGGGG